MRAASQKPKIFGTPLSDLAASTAVPDFVLLAVNQLEANGVSDDALFDGADERTVDELERRVERGDWADLTSYRNNDVIASLLRRFLLQVCVCVQIYVYVFVFVLFVLFCFVCLFVCFFFEIKKTSIYL